MKIHFNDYSDMFIPKGTYPEDEVEPIDSGVKIYIGVLFLALIIGIIYIT